EAERARNAGDLPKMIGFAKKALEQDREIMEDGDPNGFLYAAAVNQYFLEDRETARGLYREARKRAPSFYGPYYEEAKLLRGDGTNAAASVRPAALLWKFTRCFPPSDLKLIAEPDASRLGPPAPAEAPDCSDTAR